MGCIFFYCCWVVVKDRSLCINIYFRTTSYQSYDKWWYFKTVWLSLGDIFDFPDSDTLTMFNNRYKKRSIGVEATVFHVVCVKGFTPKGTFV